MNLARLMIMLLLAVSLPACKGEPPAARQRILQVATLQPELSTSYQLQRRFVGRVVAAQRVDIGFEQGGKIDSMAANQGDAVSAGQVLARLDSRFLQVEEKELQAHLREVRARQKLVKSTFKRQQSLRQKGFSAEQKLDELEAESQVLLATIDRLRASQDAIRLRLEKAVLVAPYDGVISRRYLDQGAVVAAGKPLFLLLESSRLEVLVGVPVTMAVGLRLDAEYEVTVGDQSYAATLLAVGSDLDATTRTVKLRLSLPVQSPRDGELALLSLTRTIEESGYWLPVTALIDGLRGLWNGYVLDALGEGRYRVEAVNLRVLHVEQDRVYVAGALGDKKVIAAGLHRVAPGQIVTVKPASGD